MEIMKATQQASTRFEMRLDSSLKELFDKAACIEGVSVAAFLKNAAKMVAEEVIYRHQVTTLNQEAHQRFEALISEPPSLSAKMQAAIGNINGGTLHGYRRKRKPEDRTTDR
ncbi:type II toxin-antitoxin system TacA family antitoxin [Aeromonas hydrophila]|uniref:type II toxin-antitoxin system TacA family antitoxin n=1 Tax=Aeromonas salmonicida TaxID=645 RepID=UPI001F199505|nr:DUF1778 domain-containing protein [Aeromonas salmonicida]MCE9932677.1 DUF1778 domain-containing protein [Aeromonas salmonicida]